MSSISIIGLGNMASALAEPGARRRQRRRDHRPRPGQGQGIGRRARRRHCRDGRRRPGRGHRHPRRAVRQRGGGGHRVRGRAGRQGHHRHHQPLHPRCHGLGHPRGQFRRAGDRQGRPRRRARRQGVQHPVLRCSGGRLSRGPPVGRVHRRRRRAGKGTRVGVHREPGTAPAGRRAAAHGALALENAGLLQLGLVAHSVKHTNFALGVNILS